MLKTLAAAVAVAATLPAAASAAAPRPGAVIVEQTPAGYLLTLRAGTHTAHLAVACPGGAKLGSSRAFTIRHGRFAARKPRRFEFSGRFDAADHFHGTGSARGCPPGTPAHIAEGRRGHPAWVSCPPSSTEAPLVPGQDYPFAGVMPNAALGTRLRIEYTDPDSPDGTPIVDHVRTDAAGGFSDAHAFPAEDEVYGATATARFPDDPLAPGPGCDVEVE